ncbi:MAG: decarboxylating NADP(+)-dependent phosphogluconate dehydrogenase [Gammaproteobacteria bacterium]|nr:decarboxylating NADP(+)-dependent phosphogluconate dehydrogenase [Gammaproteobacteria bacterium]MDH5800938.1 decarboxylating NADP(+)-dependent phosphogluconate dehydrogenase [Gammaproteobacteria bacterium]
MAADIGLIGLAVMGQNLVLNMNDHGYKVAVYNRTRSKTDHFLAAAAKDTQVQGTYSIEEFCTALKAPRKIMVMVQAGAAVDALIDSLLPFLEPGDIIMDGGNSLFTDTDRRCRFLAEKNLHYLGIGVSGGEEGARHGPSLMPGGHAQAWPQVKEIFQAIAAKVNGDACCEWIGAGGAGHYVKMVHNGIEYGDMQLICEAYQLLRQGLGLTMTELENTFSNWLKGVLDSYLIEITRDIFKVKDSDGEPLVDKILDTAGQKGTGKWTGINALQTGIPLTLIGEAVFARYLSSLKEQRTDAAKILKGPSAHFEGNRDQYIQHIHDALYASKIISYAQGFMLMTQASAENQWDLNYGNIALVWRGGCIIRSRFLNNIKEAYGNNKQLSNLLLDEFFQQAVQTAQPGWRKTVQLAVELGIPTPAFSSALAFYDGYRSEQVPANLLQAQRDYFGAHTYERIDQPRGQFFHTQWA